MGEITVTMPLTEYEAMKREIHYLNKEVEANEYREFAFLLDPNDNHSSFRVSLDIAKEVVKNSSITLLEVCKRQFGSEPSPQLEELLLSGKPLVEFKQP